MDREQDPHKDLRCLRRRMGWTSSDLARRLGVTSGEVELWETGALPTDSEILNRIEFLFRQAEVCSEEVKNGPQSEHALEEKHLDQINVDIV